MTPSKEFFNDGQKTEISISSDGDFGEMKKTEELEGMLTVICL